MVVCGDFEAGSTATYDAVARVLSVYGERFHAASGHAWPLVRSVDGTELAVLVKRALAAAPLRPLFYFGHGRQRPAALIGRGERVILGKGDWPLLAGRVVCATACHTEGIGRQLRRRDVGLLGYRGPLKVPYLERGAELMRDAALAGPLALAQGRTLAEAGRAAAQSYSALAERLFASTDMSEVVLAPFVQQNASAVAVVGNPDRRI